ncbi:hypothetical protein GF360_01810 [candidate division WWE3 bacterium]|nr:hypothetical protein [candidate division WWE3 bacterium]
MHSVKKTKVYHQEKALKAIKSFVEEHGRIPFKREVPAIYSRARRGFGSWNKAIEVAGYRKNPVRFAKRKRAKDGHMCDSFSEALIDNWLSK